LPQSLKNFEWDRVMDIEQADLFPETKQIMQKYSESQVASEIIEALLNDIGANIGQSVGIARMWQQIAEIK
jgi:hypothetical protein